VLAEVEGWAAQFERLLERNGPRFARPEVRCRAAGFLRRLLGGVDRKNGWQLAEHASETTPDGMQRLLTTTRWDQTTTCAATSWSSSATWRDPGSGRDWLPEEGHQVGRGATPVLGHRRADRELPGRVFLAYASDMSVR